MWGSHKLTSKDQEPEDGIALMEKFSYRVEVIEHEMRLTFERGDGARVTHVQELAKGHADIVGDQGYSDDWMYFKAGAYNQCNLGTEDMGVRAARIAEKKPVTTLRFVSLNST